MGPSPTELCTPWPQNLPPLPLTISSRSFVFPSHNIRHPESRVIKLSVSHSCQIMQFFVTIYFSLVQVCLKDLSLTDHARDKMIKLAGRRYDTETDTITIVGKRCPTRKQNREYVLYLLKVLYLESNVRVMSFATAPRLLHFLNNY